MAWNNDQRIAKMIARRNVLLTLASEGTIKPGDSVYLSALQADLQGKETLTIAPSADNMEGVQ